MKNILCIETASTNCSVALGRAGEVVAVKEDNAKNFSHAEKLHLYIKGILEENNLSLKDLDAVAISEGPGSYTGLRIGVSAAKGLCFSMGIPLISVSTLKALARQVKQNILVVPMLDARRMEVFAAVFDRDKEEIEKTSAKILDENSYKEFLDRGKVAFVGTGVDKFKAICPHTNAVFIDNKLPSAREMVELATAKYDVGDFEDVAYFEPYYLKDFIAG